VIYPVHSLNAVKTSFSVLNHMMRYTNHLSFQMHPARTSTSKEMEDPDSSN
jgi:hypothetical protein